jgi:hypothetical protein
MKLQQVNLTREDAYILAPCEEETTNMMKNPLCQCLHEQAEKHDPLCRPYHLPRNFS